MGANATTPRTTTAGLEGLWGGLKSGWQRLLSHRAIKELELRASFDLDLLAPSRVNSRIPLGMVPDCPKCQDICCAGIENVVSLRLSDIAMLIDIEQTALISRKKPRFPASMLDERPMLREMVASQLWRTLPVMKQLGQDRLCAALTPELSCGLHPHWPLSCERFPYSLIAARREIVWGSRCASKKMTSEAVPRSAEMRTAAIDVYNERIKDAVLLAHARPELEKLGIAQFLTGPDEDPFEPAVKTRLPIVD